LLLVLFNWLALHDRSQCRRGVDVFGSRSVAIVETPSLAADQDHASVSSLHSVLSLLLLWFVSSALPLSRNCATVVAGLDFRYHLVFVHAAVRLLHNSRGRRGTELQLQLGLALAGVVAKLRVLGIGRGEDSLVVLVDLHDRDLLRRGQVQESLGAPIPLHSIALEAARQANAHTSQGDHVRLLERRSRSHKHEEGAHLEGTGRGSESKRRASRSSFVASLLLNSHTESMAVERTACWASERARERERESGGDQTSNKRQ
jgi:hypothetical protein